jgi:hypothetical protein
MLASWSSKNLRRGVRQQRLFVNCNEKAADRGSPLKTTMMQREKITLFGCEAKLFLTRGNGHGKINSPN